MSADNGLIIQQKEGEFRVKEFNASTEAEWVLHVEKDLGDAVRWATRYMKHNVVEYGMRFELDETTD